MNAEEKERERKEKATEEWRAYVKIHGLPCSKYCTFAGCDGWIVPPERK